MSSFFLQTLLTDPTRQYCLIVSQPVSDGKKKKCFHAVRQFEIRREMFLPFPEGGKRLFRLLLSSFGRHVVLETTAAQFHSSLQW